MPVWLNCAAATSADRRKKSHDKALFLRRFPRFAVFLYLLMNMKCSSPPTADAELDASGLRCPLPLLRTKKSLSTMQSGQVLKVRTTDPAAGQDLQAFLKQTGHSLLYQQTQDTHLDSWIKRK